MLGLVDMENLKSWKHYSIAGYCPFCGSEEKEITKLGNEYKKCGIKDCEENAVTEVELDAPGNFVKMCEGHSSFYLKELDLQESKATGN